MGPYLDEREQPQPELLASTYRAVFSLASRYRLRSLALCPISTGFYGHPKDLAAQVAMTEAVRWLHEDAHARTLDRLIFCAFDDPNLSAYQAALRQLE